VTRALILSASLLAFAACSTEGNLLAPDHEAARLLSPEKPATGKGRGVDPVCGAPLDSVHEVWHIAHEGTVYSFDSASCMKQFEENPELYSATVR
jgi:YHS domain-containing protein